MPAGQYHLHLYHHHHRSHLNHHQHHHHPHYHHHHRRHHHYPERELASAAPPTLPSLHYPFSLALFSPLTILILVLVFIFILSQGLCSAGLQTYPWSTVTDFLALPDHDPQIPDFSDHPDHPDHGAPDFDHTRDIDQDWILRYFFLFQGTFLLLQCFILLCHYFDCPKWPWWKTCHNIKT